jgi:hypothetical protein
MVTLQELEAIGPLAVLALVIIGVVIACRSALFGHGPIASGLGVLVGSLVVGFSPLIVMVVGYGVAALNGCVVLGVSGAVTCDGKRVGSYDLRYAYGQFGAIICLAIVTLWILMPIMSVIGAVLLVFAHRFKKATLAGALIALHPALCALYYFS